MSVRPVHRVFGSKARVAAQIISLIPPRRRTWIEVFAGTASVTLAKPPHPSEHLNDMDGDIVNLFMVLRGETLRDQLIEMIALTPWSEQEFLEQRRRIEAGVNMDWPVGRAWSYLVRSWMGVAGDSAKVTGFKFDKTASKQCCQIWDRLPDRLAIAARRLKQVHVHRRPAIEMIERFGRDPDNVVFVDPPYPAASINTHSSPYRIDMTTDEHAAFAHALADCRASVIVTMSPGTVYDRALASWAVQDLGVRGLKNKVKLERLFTNFDLPLGSLFEART